MRNPMFHVFRYELLRNLRRKGFLFSTFGLPALLIAALFIIQAIATSNANRAAEEEQTAVGQPPIPDMPGVNLPGEGMNFDQVDKAGYIDHSGLFSDPGDLVETLTRYDDEAAATAAMQVGDIDVYYIIAADYLTTGDITLVIPTLSIAQIDDGLIRQLILNTLAGDIQDPDLFARLLDPANVESANISRSLPEGAVQDFDTRFILVYVFTIALMLSLFMTNGYLMQGLIEEKETRVVEILLSSLRPRQLLVGKILAFGLLGLLQMIVWLGAFLLVLQFASLLPALSVLAAIYVPTEILPLVFIYFLLAYLFFAAAYGAVGAISNSAREGPQYAVVFTFPVIIPLWGISIFITAPDSTVPVLLSLIPITAPISMIMRLLITTVPAWQIIVSMGGMALTIVGMMWLAGRLFRVQTLLAGQAPKLRDIARLVRG